jgi:hypothetical protein
MNSHRWSYMRYGPDIYRHDEDINPPQISVIMMTIPGFQRIPRIDKIHEKHEEIPMIFDHL